jgi:hypothetical protein
LNLLNLIHRRASRQVHVVDAAVRPHPPSHRTQVTVRVHDCSEHMLTSVLLHVIPTTGEIDILAYCRPWRQRGWGNMDANKSLALNRCYSNRGGGNCRGGGIRDRGYRAIVRRLTAS